MLELLAAAVIATASCAIPADLTPAPVQAQEESRIVPTTRLALAYYWWPQNCRRADSAAVPGCAAGFGFKVHGLWPDGAGKTYPQSCRAPTPLDIATVRANYCMTPSPSLLQHEWAKHGTCHWPDADAYFAAARRVADTIALPDIDKQRPTGLTAGSVRDAFVQANPGLPRNSLFIATDRNQWLTEVRICLTTAYRPTRCKDDDVGAPDPVPVRVWPR